jgi:hypothetical protein
MKGRDMGAVLGTSAETNENPSFLPKLQQLHGGRTRRIEELEAIIDGLRAALKSAEDELEREMARQPDIGDFVRCPLTNFFGRVTKVTPRPRGRPWVEINPYLTKDLPGHGTMDLYDSWELIDPPEAGETALPSFASAPRAAASATIMSASAAKLPSVSSFAWAPTPSSDEQLAGEIESLLGELWAEPRTPGR